MLSGDCVNPVPSCTCEYVPVSVCSCDYPDIGHVRLELDRVKQVLFVQFNGIFGWLSELAGVGVID